MSADDRSRFFQLFSNLENKKTRDRLISIVVLSFYAGIIRANNICHCVHTHIHIYIYTLVWLHLMCPDGLGLNLFTHNLFLFQSDLGVWMSRERNGQSK